MDISKSVKSRNVLSLSLLYPVARRKHIGTDDLCLKDVARAALYAEGKRRPASCNFSEIIAIAKLGKVGTIRKGFAMVEIPMDAMQLSGPWEKSRSGEVENFPWCCRYTVFANDEEAGLLRPWTGGPISGPPEIEITPEHREAELDRFLPPKSGFLKIQLTKRRTGDSISEMRITVMATENTKSPLPSTDWNSSRAILLPPDRNLLLRKALSDLHRPLGESEGL